jgi:hypothetical protein
MALLLALPWLLKRYHYPQESTALQKVSRCATPKKLVDNRLLLLYSIHEF